MRHAVRCPAVCAAAKPACVPCATLCPDPTVVKQAQQPHCRKARSLLLKFSTICILAAFCSLHGQSLSTLSRTPSTWAAAPAPPGQPRPARTAPGQPLGRTAGSAAAVAPEKPPIHAAALHPASSSSSRIPHQGCLPARTRCHGPAALHVCAHLVWCLSFVTERGGRGAEGHLLHCHMRSDTLLAVHGATCRAAFCKGLLSGGAEPCMRLQGFSHWPCAVLVKVCAGADKDNGTCTSGPSHSWFCNTPGLQSCSIVRELRSLPFHVAAAEPSICGNPRAP